MPTTRGAHGIVKPSIRAAEAAANAIASEALDTIDTSPARIFSDEAQRDTSVSDFTEEEEADEVADEHLGDGSNEENLLSRIRAAISYTRTTTSPLSYSHFTLPTSSTSPNYAALQLLRSAHASKIATLICASDESETYALAVKPIHQARLFQGGGSTNVEWWKGLNRAQIKAGPGASEGQIKRAQAALRERERKKKENERKRKGRVTYQTRKLDKGLAIQEGRDVGEENDETEGEDEDKDELEE